LLEAGKPSDDDVNQIVAAARAALAPIRDGATAPPADASAAAP
jgi:hypothetical protein